MLKLNIELYKKVFLIRRTEERIRELYYDDEMKTPVHLSIGKEAIEAGVCHALKSEDQIFGTYRSHGIYLARSGETDKFFAELYGKKTGLIGGKSGSMHLSELKFGLVATSAIVGSIIPVAVGAAYSNKKFGNNKIVTVFFGDGAIEEGVFWESLNTACLMQLPILLICEDNELAVFTAKEFRRGFNSITDIVSQFKCDVLSENTTDAEVIYHITLDALKLMRRKNRPCFLKLKYYRYLEHVGVNEDFNAGYRSKKEFDIWFRRDPVTLLRNKILKLGYEEESLNKIEKKINIQIENSLKLAKKAPFPSASELYKQVYNE